MAKSLTKLTAGLAIAATLTVSSSAAFAGCFRGITVSNPTETGITVSGNTYRGITVSNATEAGITVSGITVSGITVSGNTYRGITVSGITVSGDNTEFSNEVHEPVAQGDKLGVNNLVS